MPNRRRTCAVFGAVLLALVVGCAKEQQLDPKVANFRACIDARGGRESLSSNQKTLSANFTGAGATIAATGNEVSRIYPMSDANQKSIIDACVPLLGFAPSVTSAPPPPVSGPRDPHVDVSPTPIACSCVEGGVSVTCAVRNFESSPVEVDLGATGTTVVWKARAEGAQHFVVPAQFSSGETVMAKLQGIASFVDCSGATCTCAMIHAQWQPGATVLAR
jgi:hypothetical protein